MILLTNGCSWTYGGGLGLDETQYAKERLSKVWPHHLGKLLQANEVVQLAAGCGSNQRTVRTTFEWMLNQTPERLKETVAVIQWTCPDRYEYYDPIDYQDSLENIPERWAKVKVDVCLQTDHSPDGYKFAFERSQRRFETSSYQESMFETVDRISALSLMFKNFGVQHFYWNQSSRAYMYPNNIKNYYCDNFPWIDNPRFSPNELSETNRGWNYDIIPGDGHPSLQGHQQLADIIFEQIKARR